MKVFPASASKPGRFCRRVFVAATGNSNLLDGGAGRGGAAPTAGGRFVFHAGYGLNSITGFARHGAGGTDVIDLQGFGLNFTSCRHTYRMPAAMA